MASHPSPPSRYIPAIMQPLLLPLLLLLLLSRSALPCAAQTIDGLQLPIMMQLKAAWGNFIGSETWDPAKSCDTWEGVTCIKSGKITQLALFQANLKGPLPPAICSLTTLDFLDLSFNQLAGTIPNDLGQLMRLKYLNLGSNRLNSRIPRSTSALTLLRFLDMSSNILYGSIPNVLSTLKGLTFLRLGSNILTGSIPGSLAGLTNITDFDVSKNRLSGTLSPFFRRGISRVIYFSIADNFITGTTASLPILQSTNALAYVDARNNYLYGSPLATVKGLNACPFPTTAMRQTTQVYLTGNCLSSVSGCAESRQKGAAKCSSFCGTKTAGGQCGGLGICVPLGKGLKPYCLCNRGYQNLLPLKCVKAVPKPPLKRSPPPPKKVPSPPPKKSPTVPRKSPTPRRSPTVRRPPPVRRSPSVRRPPPGGGSGFKPRPPRRVAGSNGFGRGNSTLDSTEDGLGVDLPETFVNRTLG